jgi:hypothetical protein
LFFVLVLVALGFGMAIFFRRSGLEPPRWLDRALTVFFVLVYVLTGLSLGLPFLTPLDHYLYLMLVIPGLGWFFYKMGNLETSNARIFGGIAVMLLGTGYVTLHILALVFCKVKDRHISLDKGLTIDYVVTQGERFQELSVYRYRPGQPKETLARTWNPPVYYSEIELEGVSEGCAQLRGIQRSNQQTERFKLCVVEPFPQTKQDIGPEGEEPS